jgi:hypothetical protein
MLIAPWTLVLGDVVLRAGEEVVDAKDIVARGQ